MNISHTYSTAGLASAVSLQYLDLSNNRIKMIVGLEGIKNLKSLQLEDNLISSPSALRSLSFNRSRTSFVDIVMRIVSGCNHDLVLSHAMLTLI